MADHLGVDVFRVRVVFVVLSALAGAGVCAYGLLWFLCPPGDDTDPPPPGERRQAYGLAIVGVVAVVVVGFLASGTPARFLVPLVVVAVGASLVWREFDTSRRTVRTPVLTWTRVIGGVLLVITGLVVVVMAGNRSVGGLNSTLLAVGATLLGVLLLTVPLWMRMWRTLNAERAARIRNEEREEIASHLHDSVLQTLALIQKQAADPDNVLRLARGQERELRRWLFSGTDVRGDTLVAALTDVAAAVEDTYGVEVDVVTVGDLALDTDDRRWPALLGAAREAVINAAKHSGERRIDVYLEVEPERVTLFVRDRGAGFDPDDIPDDRHGVQNSIRARVERRGGAVRVKSEPGRGTDIRITMPRADVDGLAGAAEERAADTTEKEISHDG